MRSRQRFWRAADVNGRPDVRWFFIFGDGGLTGIVAMLTPKVKFETEIAYLV